MNGHISTERMNEVLDGQMSSTETEPIERHLEACAVCRNEYARLSETISAIGALPKSASTPPEAWDGIVGRIGEEGRTSEDEVPIYQLPTSARRQRRFTFSLSELAAAAIVIAFLSGGIVWATIGGGAVSRAPATASAGGPGGAAARAVSLEEDRYGEMIVGLEDVLEEGRPLLAPETLVSIEQSLASLNTAIAEIERALSDDPNSDLLRRMLSTRQRTKLGVLQRAAAAVQAQT